MVYQQWRTGIFTLEGYGEQAAIGHECVAAACLAAASSRTRAIVSRPQVSAPKRIR